MVDELPEGYYLDNFRYLLNFVSDQYAHLLHSNELAYTRDFQHLHRGCQMLYVRLIQRKGPLFRCDKLAYAEVTDLNGSIAELKQRGFLDEGEDAEIFDKLSLLTKKELLDLPEAGELDRSAKKAMLLDELADVDAEFSRFEIVRPLHGDILQLYMLLFFGNLNQNFTEFVLNDLGVTPFENYAINGGTSFFRDRHIVDQILTLYDLNEASYAIVEEGDRDSISEFVETLPKRSSNPHLARRHDRILNRLARQYERLGELEGALHLYNQSQMPPTRERQARILQKQGKVQLCTERCLNIIREPAHDEEYEFALKFLNRHLKKHPEQSKIPALDFDLLNFKPVVNQITVPNKSLKRVEEMACEWFRSQGQDAFYVENSLLSGLFGLAFWDIIFAPVEGAFFNPFQRGPTDMFTSGFYSSRQELIEKRMVELQNKQYLRNTILSCYNKKIPTANYFVNWSWLTPELIDRFIEMVSPEALTSIFRRIVIDPSNNRSGFPDLLVFKEDDYSLVEIKGPGDRLQNNQLRWLRHFDSVDIPAEVVHVSFAKAAVTE
jgi:hypothetical protein